MHQRKEASCFGGMDHCPLRARALWHFFQSAPYKLSGDRLLGTIQAHEPFGQKPYAPSVFAFGRLGAGECDQMRLLLSIELFGLGVFRPAMDQSSLQALPGEPPSHAENRRAAHLQGVGDLGVRPGWGVCSLVSLQEDASMAELARRGAAACDQALQ